MYIFFLVIYLLVAISLVLLIMLQHGKGVDIGGYSFNMRSLLEGVSTNIGNIVITRLTAVLGVLFFILSLLLGNISNKCNRKFHVSNRASLEKLSHSTEKVDIRGNVPKS